MDLKKGHTPLIVEECRKEGLLRNQCAYVLATAWHETGEYKWLREIWGPTPAQKRYEPPHAKANELGNTEPGDGLRFLGRGFVQTTGRRNYADWSKRLGIDLIKDPHLAKRPEIAVKIIVKGMMLGTFTGKKLPDYVTLKKSDFEGARRIVNGTDKASLIAGYAKEFDRALKVSGYGEEAQSTPITIYPDEVVGAIPAPAQPAPAPSSVPQPVEPQEDPAPAAAGSLASCLSSVFKKGTSK